MRSIWLPGDKKAAFTITDDTDKATLKTVSAVYELMSELGIRTTKTVWPLKPAEPSGIPGQPDYWSGGVTLEDRAYLEYCRALSKKGFEICLHGASCGNNTRERTIEAFRLMEKEGFSARVFICHSKNAENPYWEANAVSSAILRKAASLYSSYKTSGETAGSRYFWGDICREKVDYIRLFRTRELNTLKANPSMPYHRFEAPFVNFWFSATERSLDDATKEEALDSLIAENGATILYQYMHRYADENTGKVNDKCVSALKRLAAKKSVWIDNVSKILDRLKAFQLVFTLKHKDKYYMVNAGKNDISDIQIIFDRENILKNIHRENRLSKYTSIPLLRRKSILPLELLYPEEAVYEGAEEIRPGTLLLRRPFGEALINVSDPSEGPVMTFKNEEPERLEVLDIPSKAELLKLSLSQMHIFFRKTMYSGKGWYKNIIKSRTDYAYHDNW